MTHKKPKPRPIDPSTRARFKRERRCFDPAHEKEIAFLRDELEKRAKDASDRETTISSLQDRMRRMIDQGLSDEAVKTSRSEGVLEGQKQKAEEIKRTGTCFDVFHKAMVGKGGAVPLTLLEIFTVFYQLKDVILGNGPDPRLLVILPDGIKPLGKLPPGPAWIDQMITGKEKRP